MRKAPLTPAAEATAESDDAAAAHAPAEDRVRGAASARVFSRAGIGALSAAALLVLSACGGSGGDPLQDEDDSDESSADDGAIVVGSQQYYSNTIIAELYAQVLEAEGYEVDRQFEIGQREVYMPELESGAIDVFPDYTGNLLQYLDDSSDASEREEVESALSDALPDGLELLDSAEATDQDSYVVTREFADENGLSTVGDLADVDEDLSIAANAEFETRPYGPDGLEEVYDVEVSLTPVEDSGGALTVNALLDGDVQIADIYSADPSIEANDLVVLEDTENLVLPQNVVPMVTDSVDEDARTAIEELQAELSQDALIDLNTRSVEDQAQPGDIASEWLDENDLAQGE
ncbi:MAG TPA: ABC transporter substrate-binding protein [Candidatus Nesterenkonia stercoripullorum]|uniref:ABC transporter substrate-binding protein n=1 Tax=Candidatus Nesterenkonia stercoripullorum TaxID=2838701 RepID=A0A9D2A8I9_9MICC|nr:ABC transporter substrate-binding protein [Candidatus Nesterenkonia stercoripullorum]